MYKPTVRNTPLAVKIHKQNYPGVEVWEINAGEVRSLIEALDNAMRQRKNPRNQSPEGFIQAASTIL